MKEFVCFLEDCLLESLEEANRLAIIGKPGDASNEIQSGKPFQSFCFKCFLNHNKYINNKNIKNVELNLTFLAAGDSYFASIISLRRAMSFLPFRS